MAKKKGEHKVELYKDEAGEWRWRRVATRGNLPDEIVADSGEGYVSQSHALEAAQRENPDVAIHLGDPFN